MATTGKVGADYVGTLANGGLDLAPFHDQAADVPQALQDEIAAAEAGHHRRQDHGHALID